MWLSDWPSHSESSQGEVPLGHLTLMVGGSLALASGQLTFPALCLAEPGAWML